MSAISHEFFLILSSEGDSLSIESINGSALPEQLDVVSTYKTHEQILDFLQKLHSDPIKYSISFNHKKNSTQAHNGNCPLHDCPIDKQIRFVNAQILGYSPRGCPPPRYPQPNFQTELD